MRNPKRIKEVLKEIEIIWEKYPDLRLGQLIGNVYRDSSSLYYVEDYELIKELDRMYLNICNEDCATCDNCEVKR